MMGTVATSRIVSTSMHYQVLSAPHIPVLEASGKLSMIPSIKGRHKQEDGDDRDVAV